MIAGFEHPEDGDVLFDGQSVGQVPVNKRNIGMVFQSYALFPHMTVEQNVARLEQHGAAKSEIPGRVREALEMVHMEEFSKRKPKQLSGGQQQSGSGQRLSSSVRGFFCWTNVCPPWISSVWKCRVS